MRIVFDVPFPEDGCSAAIFQIATHQDGQLLKTACGSPCYAAPEMVAGQRYVMTSARKHPSDPRVMHPTEPSGSFQV